MSLSPDEAHVWTVQLDQMKNSIDRMHSLLDADEGKRAGRIRSPETSKRFILCHGSLRLILSRYLWLPPERLHFSADSRGKPNLAGPESRLSFNLSHSADLALVAVALQPVGVDVERIDPLVTYQSIAERYFSSGEIADLFSLPAERQLSSFYACWTRKEAYLKACGAGFSLPSDRFRVSLRQGESPALLEHELDPNETGIWRLIELQLPSGYLGTIAITQKIESVRTFAFL